jgi:creatinine deaminase
LSASPTGFEKPTDRRGYIANLPGKSYAATLINANTIFLLRNGMRKTNMDPFLLAAVEEAELGLSEGGIPIGSVLVHSGAIVGRGHNRRVQNGSVILHGEMDALENTGRQSAAFYRACTLYTTLSPCSMCSGAIVLYGIPRVVIGENQSFMGEEQWLSERGVQIQVIQDLRCIQLMREFIQTHPSIWDEDIGE